MNQAGELRCRVQSQEDTLLSSNQNLFRSPIFASGSVQIAFACAIDIDQRHFTLHTVQKGHCPYLL